MSSEAEVSLIMEARNSSVIRTNHFEKSEIFEDGIRINGEETRSFQPKVVKYMLFIKEPSRIEDKKLR